MWWDEAWYIQLNLPSDGKKQKVEGEHRPCRHEMAAEQNKREMKCVKKAKRSKRSNSFTVPIAPVIQNSVLNPQQTVNSKLNVNLLKLNL